MKFTKPDLELWGIYALDYFVEILNGDYSLDKARDDLKSLMDEDNFNHSPSGRK